MIQVEHDREHDVIVIRAGGVLSAKDYEMAVPEIEHALELQPGHMRVLVRLEDFRGWEIAALWKELKFDAKHIGDEGRLAIVGETRLEEWGTRLSAPFAAATMRFFPTEQEDQAHAWLAGA